MRHSKKFEGIKQSVENGKLIYECEQNYFAVRYEKMQNALDQQNKIKWTVEMIQQLKEFRVDDSEKLDKLKELLEDELPFPQIKN